MNILINFKSHELSYILTVVRFLVFSNLLSVPFYRRQCDTLNECLELQSQALRGILSLLFFFCSQKIRVKNVK